MRAGGDQAAPGRGKDRFAQHPTHRESDTTTRDKIARRKLSLLKLAAEMNNVSKACRILGYSRQQFYEIRRNYQTYGADGLIDRLPGAPGPHPHCVSQEVETAIPTHALDHPTHGVLRVPAATIGALLHAGCSSGHVGERRLTSNA